jgi:Zn-finger nucleic acid-binding protein
MNCPVCNALLAPHTHGGQTIDVCPKCEGIWFDADKLVPVAIELVFNGTIPDQPAQDAFNVHPKLRNEDEPPRPCPKCGISTQVFNYSYDSNIFLNRCPTCHGIWADKGELQRVAQYLRGNPAVNRYAETLFESVIKEREPTRASRLLRSRVLSGTMAIIYLVISGVTGDLAAFVKTAMFLILPIACIWYADAIGGYTGLMSFPRPAITQQTPGFAIALGGWILLLMPIVAVVIFAISR